MKLLYLIVILSELISVWCAMSLWRKEAGIGSKVFWSVVLLIPILGPVFYGAFDPPSALVNPGSLDNQLDEASLIAADVGWKHEDSNHDDDD